MRTRTILTAAAAAAALAVVPAANGATATLEMSKAPGLEGPRASADGTAVYLFYGTVFAQEFLVRVSDDTNQPVTGCITGGQVRIVNIATGQTVDTPASCALSDGYFHVFLPQSKRFSRPTDVVAVVDPGTITATGATVSPVQSNGVAIRIAPKFQNRSPSINPGRVYPIRGVLEGGNFAKTGSLILFKRQGSKWVRKQAKPAARSFVFRISDTGRFRVQYQPKSGNGYVASYMALTIRRV